MDVYSVDRMAFRALKNKPTQKEEPNRLNSSPEIEVNSPPRITNIEAEKLLNALEHSINLKDDQEQKAVQTRPISIRLKPHFLEQLLTEKGRGVGSKIQSLLVYKAEAERTHKEQVNSIIPILAQIDQELSKTRGLIKNLCDIDQLDIEKLKRSCRELVLISKVVCFNNKLHGKHLSEKQLKTYAFAISYHSGH